MLKSSSLQVNILMKNLIDVGIGGFVFWAFGFGLVYGDHPYSTPYYGIGHFFFAPDPKIQVTDTFNGILLVSRRC